MASKETSLAGSARPKRDTYHPVARFGCRLMNVHPQIMYYQLSGWVARQQMICRQISTQKIGCRLKKNKRDVSSKFIAMSTCMYQPQSVYMQGHKSKEKRKKTPDAENADKRLYCRQQGATSSSSPPLNF